MPALRAPIVYVQGVYRGCTGGARLFVSAVRGLPVPDFVAGLLEFRRGPWERVASVLIAAGVVMLMQPFALWLYTWSFLVTLVGTVGFIIVSHFPE